VVLKPSSIGDYGCKGEGFRILNFHLEILLLEEEEGE